MSTSHGPYEPGFPSPVYVPTTRVTPMIPALPYLQTPQQSSPVTGHPAWTQPAAESSYSSSAHHQSPVSRFSFSTSPPLTSADAPTYPSPVNISSTGREHYGSRGLSGSYHGAYPPYVNPNIGASWAASHFDSSVLHNLQSSGPANPKHPNLGETLTSICCTCVKNMSLKSPSH